MAGLYAKSFPRKNAKKDTAAIPTAEKGNHWVDSQKKPRDKRGFFYDALRYFSH